MKRDDCGQTIVKEDEKMSNKMSYEKCRNCSDSDVIYILGEKGIEIVCRITYNTLKIKNCPREEE
jgi:hypothetical protein